MDTESDLVMDKVEKGRDSGKDQAALAQSRNTEGTKEGAGEEEDESTDKEPETQETTDISLIDNLLIILSVRLKTMKRKFKSAKTE